MRRRPSLRAVASLAAVGFAVVFILLQLQPRLLVAPTTPAGGDMGAHVWGPAYLRDHVLPNWRVTGWTPDWYAGFPAFHFYFPLPSLLIVALDVLLPIHYGVAFKLVSVSGLVGLPVAAWAFGRLSGMRFPAPPLLALATVPFVFDRFHTIWGGNMAATLAGEFAFSMALSLALLFVGVFARSLDTGRHRALAAGLLAATALTHLLPTAFAVAAAGALLLVRRPDRRRWALAVTVAAVAFCLAAFWVVPFLARLPYSNDMGWERTQAYVKHLLPFLSPCESRGTCPTADRFFHAEHTRHLAVVVPMAAVGALAQLVRRRRAGMALVLTAAAMAIGFVVLPHGPIWNARLLPFWYLTLYLLAALAVAELVIAVNDLVFSRDGRAPAFGGVLATVAAAALVFVVVGAPLGAVGRSLGVSTADRSFLPDWARWNYSGYERKPAYPEYREVVSTMEYIGRRHGCGRAMWEYEPQLDRYGTPMALMLLPHFTGGCIGSMEGLYFESSASVAYHFLNQSELSATPSRAMRGLPYTSLDVDAGVRHLQLMGVRYYMALTPEAQSQARANPHLRLLATTTQYPVSYPGGEQQRWWEIYEVDGSDLVVPLEFEPVVVGGIDGRESWLEASVAWYQDPERWDVPLAASGPEEWQRLPGPAAEVPHTPVRTTEVSAVEVGDDRIAFQVSRPGVPVLVKASYFPNWKADGARGPWRVTPNLMAVVPTATHVELRYGWTAPDLAGWGLTLIGLVALGVLARRRPVALADAEEPPAEERGPGHAEPDGASRTDGDASRRGEPDGEVLAGVVPAPPSAPPEE